MDDFEPPKRYVNYIPLKDAQRKKPTKKKTAPKRTAKREATDDVRVIYFSFIIIYTKSLEVMKAGNLC